LDLEDVEALYPERVDKLLEETGSANLDDLYSAIGSGAIRLKDLSEVLDLVEISKTGLNWTSINVFGAKMSNKPGVLARLAGMISDAGGNIVRSVNNTLPDGGFYLRLVLADVESSKLEKIRDSYRESGMEFEDIEIV
jgi:(p)ppGpp synthase/HD superfamily hydrolase